MYNSAEEQKFKQAIRDISPQMGLAQIVTLGSETHLKETRSGHGPVRRRIFSCIFQNVFETSTLLYCCMS